MRAKTKLVLYNIKVNQQNTKEIKNGSTRY